MQTTPEYWWKPRRDDRFAGNQMKVDPRQIFPMIRRATEGFFADGALSHAAAMAFYAATSLAPVLLIVIAIAGAAVGHEAAEVALTGQLSGLLGPQSADLLQAALRGASDTTNSTLATIVGVITLLVAASGVFGEMQTSLNMIWKIDPPTLSLKGLVRARAASLGLVAALGFLLLVSLAASAAVSALTDVINARLPLGTILLSVINTVVSLTILAALFAAIYKVLPDRTLTWRDVGLGAALSAVLFTIGKSLIGWYLGTSAIASSYGAAGSLVVLLLWVFYSSAIFLFGAELTRAYATTSGNRTDVKPLENAPNPKQVDPETTEKPHASVAIVVIASVSAFGVLFAQAVFRNRARDNTKG